MKALILFLFITLPILAGAQLDCSLFQEGRFVYTNYSGVLEVRKGSKQKSYANGKVAAIWKVEWMDECSFKLICKKVKQPLPPIQKGDVLHCEIIHIQDRCFQVSVEAKRNEKVIVPKTIGEMCLE